MQKGRKTTPAVAEPIRKYAVIYARVSSKEQEKEGFSIPAQLKLLKEYAAAQSFAVAQEYVDVETAKQTGRAAFGEMVAYLKAHPPVRVPLVEKTDRLYRKSGAKVPVSAVHSILRNRLYTGQFEWNGKLIQGKHEPLVSVELWERVQGVLDGRFAKKHRRMSHDFAFSGLIACSTCGCSVVGEIKKQRYVYYHRTGYADKCLGNPASCRRRYVREEI